MQEDEQRDRACLPHGADGPCEIARGELADILEAGW